MEARLVLELDSGRSHQRHFIDEGRIETEFHRERRALPQGFDLLTGHVPARCVLVAIDPLEPAVNLMVAPDVVDL